MTPNPNNYASLEMARKLQEAGIALETEKVHVKVYSEEYPGAVIIFEGFDIRSAKDTFGKDINHGELGEDFYPAPSMAEAWRELPSSIEENGVTYTKTLKDFGVIQVATYESLEGNHTELKQTTNPTDALCELLIWVKGNTDD